LLFASCHGQPRANDADTPTTFSAPAGTYAISGTVRDTRLRPVAGARIDVIAPGFEGRHAVSDDTGWYRIPELSGGVQVHATKVGYFSDARAKTATERALVNFTLQPLERIAADRAVQSVLTDEHPLCVRQGDHLAGMHGLPCHRFLFTAERTGTMEILVTWDARARLSIAIIAPEGETVQSVARASGTHLAAAVESGRTYEVQVLADREASRSVEDFELIARIK
jgi:hypothetical protein